MDQGTWIAVGTVLGGVIAAAGGWGIKLLQARASIRSADAKDIGGQWQTLLTILQAEIGGLRNRVSALENRIVELQAEHHECQVNHARAMDRIEELTAILADRNIPVRPWSADVTPPAVPGPPRAAGQDAGPGKSSPDVRVQP